MFPENPAVTFIISVVSFFILLLIVVWAFKEAFQSNRRFHLLKQQNELLVLIALKLGASKKELLEIMRGHNVDIAIDEQQKEFVTKPSEFPEMRK